MDKDRLLSLLQEERYIAGILFKFLADFLLEKKDVKGLTYLLNLIMASVDYTNDLWFAVYEYIVDCIHFLQTGEDTGKDAWYEENIDDKKLYEDILREISSRLKP